MSEFTVRDVKILLAMLLTVLILTFSLGSAGITDNEVDINDIPELNIDESTMDFAGDVPTQPRGSSSSAIDDTVSIEMESGSVAQNGHAFRGESFQVRLEYVDNSTAEIELEIVDGVSETHLISTTDEGRVIQGSLTQENAEMNYRMSVSEASDEVITVDYQLDIIVSDDSDGLTGAVVSIASTIIWLVSVIFYGIVTIIQFFINIAIVIALIFSFIFGVFAFLFSSYAAVVSSAGGVATLVVLFPGLLLTAMLSKLTLAILQVLWIG